MLRSFLIIGRASQYFLILFLIGLPLQALPQSNLNITPDMPSSDVTEQDSSSSDLKGTLGGRVDGYVASSLSEWLGNAEVSVSGLLEDKPQFGILTIRPLYESENVRDTVFSQASVFNYDGRQTINIGMGYRRMTADEHWLFGVNAFFDHEFPYDHQRASIGVEARSSVVELNANRYFGLSNWRNGEDDLGERALDGYDLEAGIVIPYMPSGRFYHREFVWEGEDGVADMEGNTTSLYVRGDFLIPGLSLEAGTTNFDNSRDDRDFLEVTFRYPPPQAEVRPIFVNDMFNYESMRERRLERVRRENLIVKQFRGRGTISFR
jgi:hypothetical protein